MKKIQLGRAEIKLFLGSLVFSFLFVRSRPALTFSVWLFFDQTFGFKVPDLLLDLGLTIAIAAAASLIISYFWNPTPKKGP